MKKILLLIISIITLSMLSGCSDNETVNHEIQLSKMEAISELAVMDCYFHNVAKYSEEDATGFWIWTKDKNFWIEYSGIVTIGIDASQLSLDLEGTHVIITLPHSKLLSSKVDEATLTKDSFYLEKSSAAITAEDEIVAFSEAQTKMEETASQDTTLLAQSDQKIKILLSDYVNNVGELTGIQYTIEFIYLD